MITFDEVSFSYKGTEENDLNNISLHIPKGQCVLLCGASGCGKTTLTRLINGLIPYFFEGEFVGKMTVNGINTAEVNISQLSDIVGTVFQNPRTQFFNTDTDSEIVFGLENSGLPATELRNRLEEVSQDLQIQGLRNRSIFDLSGGEKQKIAFASVYASDPEIFVLDEPSSNLDYRSIKDLNSLIKKIKMQGKTIIIAEHRIWYLMDIADRVIFMENGKITSDMDIQEFRNLPEKSEQLTELRCRSLSEIKTDISYTYTSTYTSNRVLEIKGLTAKIEEKVILNNISFRANGGEIIAVTGENGAGKTTLARALCGLGRDESGVVSFDNKLLSKKMRREKSYMVMQDVGHQLFTDSVHAECQLGIKKTEETSMEEVLTLLSLSDMKDRHPLSLSGGQKQRLAVAVSMLCGKEILIFDEPTSGLDIKSMKKVGRLIERLADDKKIIIVITHDIEFIKMICSRILILSDGKIIKEITGKEKAGLEKYLCGINPIEKDFK